MNNKITYTNKTDTIQSIQEQIQNQLSKLSLTHLKTILDVTTYLSDKESEEATQEIREITEIMGLLKVAETEAKEGHLIDWEDTENDL